MEEFPQIPLGSPAPFGTIGPFFTNPRMKPAPAILSLTALLASCSAATSGPITLPLQERLRNPLVAERYWSDMAEHMANFVRMNDPLSKDPVKAAIIDGERQRALERVAQARALKKEGVSGVFLNPTPGEDTMGEALLRGSTLSFGPSFSVDPNPSVHVLLTTVVDPRNVEFPDKTSIDLGLLQTAYGSQEYAVPAAKTNPDFRTAVLYDTQLSRLVGFAQLTP